MIMVYGMSDVAGLMVLEKARSSFLGNGFGQPREFSEEMANRVDNSIKSILDERYLIVKEKLSKYKEAIEIMTKELLDIAIATNPKLKRLKREDLIDYYESDPERTLD
jgi:cell division protease FtsH